MKLFTGITLCVVAMIAVWGCAQTDERMQQIIAVGTSIAELQNEYYPAITELGKVAVHIETAAERKDATAKSLANDIAQAHEMIKGAFDAGKIAQANVIVGDQNMGFEEYVAAQKKFRDLLKEALDKTKAAVDKSHEVLGALESAKDAK